MLSIAFNRSKDYLHISYYLLNTGGGVELIIICAIFFVVFRALIRFFIKAFKEIDELNEKEKKEQEVKTKLAEMENEAKEVIKSSPLPVSPAPSVPSESIPLTRAMPYYRRFTHGDNDYLFRSTQAARLGEAGESVVLDDLKRLDKRYAILHNVVLKTELGDTTQIDFVVFSVYGIFVLEVKNYSGWIFGSEPQELWTQVLYHEKNKFLNPLRQNYKHIKALSYILALPISAFHSVIVFPSSDITFKTSFPSNVVRSAYNYIRQYKNKIFTGENIETLTKTIISAQKTH